MYSKKTVIFILIAVCLTTITLFGGTLPQITNIAPGADSFASGNIGPAFSPGKINDGDPNTAWGVMADGAPQWIYIDLGSVKDICGFSLDWYDIYYATDYDLCVSTDRKSWKTIYSNRYGGAKTLTLYTGQTCRYIGIYLKDARDVGYGIAEFEVFEGVANTTVEIEDPVLSSEILDEIRWLHLVNDDKIITAANILNIKTLTYNCDPYYPPVESLQGLEHALFLESIEMKDSLITDIGPLTNLPLLNSIELSGNKITVLPDLAGLDSITYMYLRDNDIHTIEAQGGSGTLRELNLENNMISTIEGALNYTTLEYINLNNNAVSSLAPLAPCSKLQFVYARHNMITSLTDFGAHPDLTVLSLSHNRLTSVAGLADRDVGRADPADHTSMIGSTRLERIELDNNALSSLEGFGLHRRLAVLTLGNNDLTDITEIQTSYYLKSLGADNNKLIDCNAVKGLPLLSELDLSHNMITDITGLAECPGLSELSLAHNALQSLAGLGYHFPLEILRADNNRIDTLNGIDELVNLREFDLSYNNVSNLDNAMSIIQDNYHPHDLVLLFHHNAITDISGLNGLTRIGRLDLSHNAVADCTPLQTLTSCNDIDLSNNNLSDATGLENLRAVYYLLDLASNPLTDISALHITGGYQELIIDLFDTQITDITPLTTLKYFDKLDISNTPVTDLSPLAVIGNINTLEISNTPVTDISPLASFNSLVEIRMAHTNVSDITPLGAHSSLSTVDISNTAVTNLDALAALYHLDTLDISNLPVTDISPLAETGCKLSSLTAWQTPLEDISPLVRMSSLMYINAGSSNIRDLTPLAQCSVLRHVELDDCAIADIAPLETLSLHYLDISKNQVKDLSVIKNHLYLKMLNVTNNGMFIKEDGGQGSVNLDVVTTFIEREAEVKYVEGNVTGK